MSVDYGPAMVLAGLLLGVLGAFLTLFPLVRLGRNDVQDRAGRASNDGSNSGRRDLLLVQMFRERRLVRWGLAVLLLGFGLQGDRHRRRHWSGTNES
jgi:hypothetical protein